MAEYNPYLDPNNYAKTPSSNSSATPAGTQVNYSGKTYTSQGNGTYTQNPATPAPTPAPTNPTPVSSGGSGGGSEINTKDPNNNPYGENGWWDAADGWKQKVSDASAEAAAREAQARADIENGWNNVFGYIDQVGQRLPGQYETQNTRVNDLYGTSQTKLNEAKDYATGQINSNQKKTLTALADDYRNALIAANTYLGARGASDSSASDRYGAALAKSVNKARGDVYGNTSNQLAELQRTYSTQIADLDEWKNSKLFELGQWYEEQKNTLDYQRMSASGEKATALANLNAQLHQTALDRLRDIESQANSWKMSVDSWLMDQQSLVNQSVQTMNGLPVAPTYSFDTGVNTVSGNGNKALGAGYGQGGDDERAGQSQIGIINSVTRNPSYAA